VRICIIPSWYPTAADPVSGVFFQEQAMSLQRAGHDVAVLFPEVASVRDRLRGAPASVGITVGAEDGLPVYRASGARALPTTQLTFGRLWVRLGLRLFERYAAEHGKPDVVHAHSALPAGLCAMEIERRHGVPFVLTEHSTAYARGALRPWQLRRAGQAFAAASQRVVVSPALGDVLEFTVGDAALPWRWVPNMVDERFFAEAPASAKSDGVTFLTVGNLHPKKGHADLLRAFALAFPGRPDIRLRIAGEGSQRDRLVSLARELDIASRVAFLGAVSRERVREEMAAADAFVLPSHVETFGVVVIEALASGLPVVVTASGGPESIVTDADGLVVEPGDPPALAAALVSMCDRLGEYDAHDMRARCRSRFGEAAVVAAIESVYAAVLAGGER
jgi:glycosyltransferase involved in cell wall biosynthesis